jgi:hypothetical protein
MKKTVSSHSLFLSTHPVFRQILFNLASNKGEIVASRNGYQLANDGTRKPTDNWQVRVALLEGTQFSLYIAEAGNNQSNGNKAFYQILTDSEDTTINAWLKTLGPNNIFELFLENVLY